MAKQPDVEPSAFPSLLFSLTFVSSLIWHLVSLHRPTHINSCQILTPAQTHTHSRWPPQLNRSIRPTAFSKAEAHAHTHASSPLVSTPEEEQQVDLRGHMQSLKLLAVERASHDCNTVPTSNHSGLQNLSATMNQFRDKLNNNQDNREEG